MVEDAVRMTTERFPYAQSEIQYLSLPGVTHVSALAASQRVWMDWIADRFADHDVESDCNWSELVRARPDSAHPTDQKLVFRVCNGTLSCTWSMKLSTLIVRVPDLVASTLGRCDDNRLFFRGFFLNSCDAVNILQRVVDCSLKTSMELLPNIIHRYLLL